MDTLEALFTMNDSSGEWFAGVDSSRRFSESSALWPTWRGAAAAAATAQVANKAINTFIVAVEVYWQVHGRSTLDVSDR